MIVWKTNMCFIKALVCGILLGMCDSLPRHARYTRNTILDRWTCQGTDIIITENLPNARSCLSYCTGKGCRTVFYNPGTNECVGCYTYYVSTDGLTKEPGNLAYVFDIDCPRGYGKYKTSCYNVTQEYTTWCDGMDLCTSVAKSNLVVIDTEEENAYLASWLPSLNFPDQILNIGVYFDEEDWVTVHGSISYTNWDIGQPDLFWSDNCVALVIGHNRWHDVPCNYISLLVCEIDMLP